MTSRKGALSLILPVVLIALLAGLGALQYRWTGEISRAEAVRMQASLRSSVHRFTVDVDEEFVRLLRYFRIDDREPTDVALARSLTRYRDEAPFPDLVRDVYFVEEDSLRRLAPDDALEPERWRPGLESVRERLRRFPRFDRRRRRPVPVPAFFSKPPAVAIPAIEGRELHGHVLVLLSQDVMVDALLPELVARHFMPSGELDYDIVIVDRDGELFYKTPSADSERVLRSPDARGGLVSVRGLVQRVRPRRGPRPPPPPGSSRIERELTAGRWTIYARHRAGSLETAVASARRRNLAIGFGIMALLGASVLVLAASTRRAAELTNRKMEFVAGVSHELRTPVAVVRSAGQNLADGSVSDRAQVKRYGTLIEAEGKRLNDLVDQVLELAGIHSQRRRYEKEPVSARALTELAVSDASAQAKARGVPIIVDPSPADVFVLGDEDALRRAIANLVGNAIKHGGHDNEVRLGVVTTNGEVGVVVSDRGPGIRDEDREHLFDAFYRGRHAVKQQVQGSGLGLSLVDHIAREHGGRIDVDSVPGKGSRITLWLPAARDR